MIEVKIVTVNAIGGLKMKYAKFNVAIVAAVILLTTISTFAQQPKTILSLAKMYSTALQQYKNQNKKSSVELVIIKGNRVAGEYDDLEKLTVSEYELLKRRMIGFDINREEVLYIVPDSRYFFNLAKTHGIAADLEYFKLMQRIKPGNVWAAYRQQQTDVTGCTIYGNGSLTQLYGKALRFKHRFPKSFTSNINEAIQDILEEFSEGGCACGSSDSVVKEFDLFIRYYPKDPNTTKIKANLRQIKKQGNFRYNCHSG